MSEYQKKYKEKYHRENKIVAFPLKKHFYNELSRRSSFYDQSVNTYAKNIVTNFLNNEASSTLTTQQQEFISKYIHISRGIANNINQIAHNTNMGNTIDINVLIKSLRHYEEEFKKFISNI